MWQVGHVVFTAEHPVAVVQLKVAGRRLPLDSDVNPAFELKDLIGGRTSRYLQLRFHWTSAHEHYKKSQFQILSIRGSTKTLSQLGRKCTSCGHVKKSKEFL